MKKSDKKLWGGRFNSPIHPLTEEFTKSLQYDYKLARYDLLGSMVHVEVLKKGAYLKPWEAKKLQDGLKRVADVISGKNKHSIAKSREEDIHTYIQNQLERKSGSLALKLHTARSRNDQVSFASRLYVKDSIAELNGRIRSLQSALNYLGEKNRDVIIPGFTHMQHAQPVYLKDYFFAYKRMLGRDARRLSGISKNIRVVLGAGAISGTPINAGNYNINPAKFISQLKMRNLLGLRIHAPANSLDTVSDRDFVIETISALSIAAMHLSRLAEDLIIWSTSEFDFIEIDEAFCTGSSLMPQKKNPDVLELSRGYAGRLYGNLTSVLTMMKGLPLTYNRDMQLDKEPLFNSFDIILKELPLFEGILRTLKINPEKIKERLQDQSLYATDLAYYLVDKGMAFKEAHTLVGALVRYSITRSIQIKDISQDTLDNFSDKLKKREISMLFDPKVSLKTKRSVNNKRL